MNHAVLLEYLRRELHHLERTVLVVVLLLFSEWEGHFRYRQTTKLRWLHFKRRKYHKLSSSNKFIIENNIICSFSYPDCHQMEGLVLLSTSKTFQMICVLSIKYMHSLLYI